MKLINYIKNNYNFYILIGLTLAFHFVSAEAFLVGVLILSLFYICLDMIINKHIPLNKKYILIIPLILYLCLGIVFGLTNNYDKHNIIRDIFYHTNTLAVIILCLSMFTNKITKEQVFWAILVVGTIMGIFTLLKIKEYVDAGNEISWISIRHEINNTGYIINYIAFISFLFIKRFKYITIPLSIFNLGMAILSFSRVLLILLILIILFMMLYYLIYSKHKILILSIMFIIVMGLYFASYTKVYQEYVLRFSVTINELNPNQDWTINSNVNNAWRGYEIWMICDNYDKSSLLNKIFGNGFGSFIYSEKSIWTGIENVHEIAIFHNGYFGALFKCGIVGLVLYISFIISLYVFSFKYIKNKKDLFLNLALITYIVLATYVVMGLFHKEVWFPLVFLIIYLIKYHADGKDKVITDEIRGEESLNTR